MTGRNCYIKSKKFYRSKHNRGLTCLSFLIVLGLAGLFFAYLFQVNGLVSCNYQIRKQEQKISQLELESQRLEIEIAQWQSPANLEELVNSLKMVEVEEILYLGGNKAVAEK
ncbi:hypothetical protein KKE13_00060 [Patescibacteria group bacterium]|nr:hypothetical protein [Patescibacteria group bacterium]